MDGVKMEESTLSNPAGETASWPDSLLVEAVRREPPDIRKLGKVLLAVALAEQQQGTEPAQEGAG